jgi:hypothetical protein
LYELRNARAQTLKLDEPIKQICLNKTRRWKIGSKIDEVIQQSLLDCSTFSSVHFLLILMSVATIPSRFWNDNSVDVLGSAWRTGRRATAPSVAASS